MTIDDYRASAERDKELLRTSGDEQTTIHNMGPIAARYHEAQAAILYWEAHGTLPRWAQ